MTLTTSDDVNYDPYDVTIGADPHPVFRRLRAEAPLYHNEQHGFYALSRFSDVEGALTDAATFSSARGVVLEMIKNNVAIPPGTVIFEDDPEHAIHRNLLAKLFTPRVIAGLEPQIRELCVQILDERVGAGGFDFVQDLGKQLPMRVISLLLGIPEEDQEGVRDTFGGTNYDLLSGEMFSEYITWRAEHPADDLMTELMTAEFEDEHGVTRTLTQDEVKAYTTIIAAAGNETTGRLIGWTGKLLADHPDQRRDLVENNKLIPAAIHEILRCEPPGLHTSRYVTRDVEYHGRTVPAGSPMMLIMAAANRDDSRFENPDRFDIHRKMNQILTFIVGPHYCLGAALARLEGRIALEEVLRRFPTWEVDEDGSEFLSTLMFRGWEKLPVRTS